MISDKKLRFTFIRLDFHHHDHATAAVVVTAVVAVVVTAVVATAVAAAAATAATVAAPRNQ